MERNGNIKDVGSPYFEQHIWMQSTTILHRNGQQIYTEKLSLVIGPGSEDIEVCVKGSRNDLYKKYRLELKNTFAYGDILFYSGISCLHTQNKSKNLKGLIS